MKPPDDAVVAEKLIAVLRGHSGSADLQFVDPPSRIPGGFECFTYGFSVTADDGGLTGPLILRMFADRGAVNQGRREAAF